MYTDEVFTTERAAGVLVFFPLLQSLGIIKAIEDAHFPSTTQLSSTQMVLSFLALKLMGNARWSHDSVWNMDRALGLFAGLNVLPKATTLSSYSYRVQRSSNLTLLKNLVGCFKSENGKGIAPKMLIFDARFTTYENLSKLNQSPEQIKFLTIRRRGKKLIEQVNALPEEQWQIIQVERAKGKKQEMRVYDHKTTLSKYDGEIREIILTDHGRQRPTFLITNDFDLDVKQLIRKYVRRWMVEKEIAEQITFFHLNSPSSSIVVKVDFDLTLSLLAHNLYRHLAQKLHGFEQCNAETIHRDFLDNGATITMHNGSANVSIKKKTHLPILLDVDLIKNETILPWMGGLKINFSGGSVT